MAPVLAKASVERTMTVRVTYYFVGEPGSAKTSKGLRPVEGRTVAVDPKVIPYWSKVVVPGWGELRAEDTGRHVRSRKASKAWGSNAPVIDIFLRSKARYLEVMDRKPPMFMQVEVRS